MAKGIVLYNPAAGDGDCRENAHVLEVVLHEPLEFYDIRRITNYRAFLRDIPKEDFIIVAGGDGTLNRFVNACAQLHLPNRIFCFPAGSGNDFARDMGRDKFAEPFEITDLLRDLPTVQVEDQCIRFLNGVGYGIDGYCCVEGEKLRASGGKKINYTSIAIGGLLGKYRPTGAHVTVDGESFYYKKVWIAPTMFGRFYGGGMMPAPMQDRLTNDGTVSLMVLHDTGRLQTLFIFPSLFKGEHVKYKKHVAIHRGRQITVEFDQPRPLQIDGEVIENVKCYSIRTKKQS